MEKNKEMNFKEALELATKYHKGQKRWGGEEYITHPIAVADRFEHEDYKIVAILHDILEDTKMTVFELIDTHNLNSFLCLSVVAITKRKGQNYLDYTLQVKLSEIATAVKIEDLKHNLSDLKDGSMKDKYILALYILKN